VKGRLIVAMYHPAAALHQPKLKSTIEQDFMHLPDYIQQAKNAQSARNNQPAKSEKSEETKTSPDNEDPTQLSLF
jgi:DNA polymerase